MSEEKQEQEEQAAPCDRCGHSVQDTIKPEEEEVQQYLRCILGGEQFTKRYNLFGETVSFEFTTISSSTSTQVGNILADLPVGTPLQMNTEAIKVKLLFYLKAVGDTTYSSIPEDIETHQQSDVLFDERFGDKSEDYVALMIRVYNEFIGLITILGQSGFDKAFYQGAGLI